MQELFVQYLASYSYKHGRGKEKRALTYSDLSHTAEECETFQFLAGACRRGRAGGQSHGLAHGAAPWRRHTSRDGGRLRRSTKSRDALGRRLGTVGAVERLDALSQRSRHGCPNEEAERREVKQPQLRQWCKAQKR